MLLAFDNSRRDHVDAPPMILVPMPLTVTAEQSVMIFVSKNKHMKAVKIDLPIISIFAFEFTIDLGEFNNSWINQHAVARLIL